MFWIVIEQIEKLKRTLGLIFFFLGQDSSGRREGAEEENLNVLDRNEQERNASDAGMSKNKNST